jgi:hypothetical protein
MRREEFIAGLLAISATGNSGSRTMDSCDHNDALLYDRRLNPSAECSAPGA